MVSERLGQRMGFNCLGNAAGSRRMSDKLKPTPLLRASPRVQPAEAASSLCQQTLSKGREEGVSLLCPKSEFSIQELVRLVKGAWARSQALWLLVQSWGEPHFQYFLLWLSRFPRATPRPGPASHPQKAHPALPTTHHPLHLLGHLVAAQVVVEGALGPPMGRVVPDGVGPLAIHLGDHGLLVFLGEQHRCISLWAGPTR